MDLEFTQHLSHIEENIKQFLPPESNSQWALDSFGKEDCAVVSEHIHPLLETTRSLVDLGGKRWRPLLLVLCSCAQSNNNPDNLKMAYSLAPLVEFVHTASLIHDDIEDHSETRRGKPAAYITYGMDTAINAGSWLYFQAATCIEKLNCSVQMKKNLYSVYTMELRRLHLGQAMDIAWHRNTEKIPTVNEYLAMVKNKTGTLSSLSAKIGTLCGGGDEEKILTAGSVASEIGAGFQIIDDVINLTTGNPGKKRGDDIVEGKKSLPVLMFVQSAAEEDKSSLLECFKTAGKDGIESPCVEKAISLLEKNGAIKTAAQKGIEYIEEGCRNFLDLYGKENLWAKKMGSLFKAMIPSQVIELAGGMQ